MPNVKVFLVLAFFSVIVRSHNHTHHNHTTVYQPAGLGFPNLVHHIINSTKFSQSNTTSDKTRIIGGVETARNEFPFIVSLSRNGGHFCGGAIISPEWVLTAAHCASEPDFMVTAGEHNLEQNEGTEQKSRAMNVIRHPNYNPVTFENDICLVKVSPPFAYDNYVQPFTVPSTHYVGTGMATVAGWGTEDEAFQVVSPVLRKVTVPLVEAITCTKQYGKNFVPHIMICAGEEEGGKDACQGDSGGPLMCDDYHKGATLCGIVSFGLGCARPELAGVYTKVAYFSDWVDYEIRRNSGPNAVIPTRTTQSNRRPNTTPKPTPAHHGPHFTPPPGYVVIIRPVNSTIDHRDRNKGRSGANPLLYSHSSLGLSLTLIFVLAQYFKC